MHSFLRTYRKNIFYFIQFCILVFGISFPFWQTAEVFEIYPAYFVIVPGLLFAAMFGLAFGTLFDLPEMIDKYLKKILSYWLGGGFILFWLTIVFFLLQPLLGFNDVWFLSLTVGCSAVCIAYAYYKGYKLQIQSLSFESAKVNDSYAFVHLSDMHIGSNNGNDCRRIVDALKTLDYDFVVITGDLIDEDFAEKKYLDPLREIKKPIYYITGNHEYYLRHKKFQDFINETDIIDVNDTKESFREIDIIGIDEKTNPESVFKDVVDENQYTLSLIHEPDAKKMHSAESAGVDMVLAGHTHNGQIWPFTLMVRGRYKFVRGVHYVKNMIVNVSQGTLTWGPKMRLGTQNEIIHITLTPKRKT